MASKQDNVSFDTKDKQIGSRNSQTINTTDGQVHSLVDRIYIAPEVVGPLVGTNPLRIDSKTYRIANPA